VSNQLIGAFESLTQDASVALLNRILPEVCPELTTSLDPTSKGRLLRIFNATAEILTFNVLGPVHAELKRLGVADQVDASAMRPVEVDLVDEDNALYHLTTRRIDWLLENIKSEGERNGTLYDHDWQRYHELSAEVARLRAEGSPLPSTLHEALEGLYGFTARWAPYYRRDPAAVAAMQKAFDAYANSADEDVRNAYFRAVALQTGRGSEKAKMEAAQILKEQIDSLREDVAEQTLALERTEKQIEALNNRRDLLL
jgi:hypothetical protein